jgi:hypothetical protein
MRISEAYADLGGGITDSPDYPSKTTHHECIFDPASGWCGCGRRDDGSVAEGSPAWRSARASSPPNRTV